MGGGGSSPRSSGDEVAQRYFDTGQVYRDFSPSGLIQRKKARDFALNMKEFAKALRYIPGYKFVIFFSWGISSSLLYDPYDTSVRNLYEDMSKELASSKTFAFSFNHSSLFKHK